MSVSECVTCVMVYVCKCVFGECECVCVSECNGYTCALCNA